jgi:tRNA pseudouridine55 synthase
MPSQQQQDFVAGEVLLLDKPYQWTSFDVVNRIKYQLRHQLGTKVKVGHAGTLDPLATGLLIVCTGRFTRRIEEFQAQEKEYTGTFIVGATTPCCDLEKQPDTWYPTAHISDEQLHSTTRQFTGSIQQIPPVFSAVRVKGKRAYDLARSGQTDTVMPSRTIEITAFELTRIQRTSSEDGIFIEVDFRVVCSKGTYIRSLARDFGLALSSGAYLGALRRTRIGNFHVNDSLDPATFTTNKS